MLRSMPSLFSSIMLISEPVSGITSSPSDTAANSPSKKSRSKLEPMDRVLHFDAGRSLRQNLDKKSSFITSDQPVQNSNDTGAGISDSCEESDQEKKLQADGSDEPVAPTPDLHSRADGIIRASDLQAILPTQRHEMLDVW